MGDSALYTQSTIQRIDQQNGLFVTRVPSQIKAAKELIIQTKRAHMQDIGSGYWVCEDGV